MVAKFSLRAMARSEVLAVGLLASMAAVAVAYATDPSRFLELGAIAAATGFVTGGSLLIRYGRRTPNADGRSFSSFGIGVILAGVWMIVTGVAASVIDVGAFGVMDFGFFIVYGFLLNGLIRFPALSQGWRSQIRMVLDGLVGAVSVGTLVWLQTMGTFLVGLEGLSATQRLIGLVYPVLDVAIVVGVMVLILRRGQYRFDIRLLALTIAFSLQAAADLNFLTSSPTGLLDDAEPNMLFFMGAAAAIVLTGISVTRSPAPVETADRSTPLWSYALPYIAGFSLVTVDLARSNSISATGARVLDVASLVVMLLVIARQSLAIHENRTKVDEERRSLIASVSHELRTPLTSMIGFLTVLDEAGDTLPEDERVEISELVLEQANYMGRMVTDIVLLARDTPQQMTLRQSLVPAGGFVSAAVDTIGTDASRIDLDIDSTLMMRIDVDRVRQAVVNLMTNAIRYGADRCLLVLKAEGSSLVIEVHDDGPGVPKKYQRTIWDRFERGINQLNATVPGTGLGLAIVDMIARAHGGEADYRASERLGGACFSLVLADRVVSRLEEEPVITPASPPVSVRSL